MFIILQQEKVQITSINISLRVSIRVLHAIQVDGMLLRAMEDLKENFPKVCPSTATPAIPLLILFNLPLHNNKTTTNFTKALINISGCTN